MHSRKDALIKYVLDNYMNTLNSGVVVNEAKIALICSTDRYTIEGILSLDPSEAIMQYVKENMDIRTKLKDLAEMNTERRISMNRMFDKGYMEDMFEIDSPQFNEDMIIWHEKNLELLSSYGHNVEEWKLKR
jgi:hypothetical protein